VEHLEVVEMFGVKGLSFSDSFRAFIDSFLKCGKIKILDLGCGYGQKSLFMASLGWEVTALDIDLKKLDFLKEKAKEYHSQINVVKGSMDNLPFQDRVFDAVICLSTIHHQKFYSIQNTLSEIHRVLRPGGRLFFDILSTKDASYAIGEMIEPGTKLGGREGEENVPHHYTTKKELEEILTNYSKTDIDENEFSYSYQGEKYTCVLFEITAKK
jgi:ubiquinone/menaquinone biosynthesis C-methylase UbiE